jgi:predicted AAA+ superfamily ATPase
MTFGEFLEALGRSGLRRMLVEKSDFEPFETAFHDELLDLLKKYYFVGGMPEAVARYAAGGDMREVRTIQIDILEAHGHDFRKHTGKAEAVRLGRVWDAVPGQLARENKKWRYAEVARHARARDYADAVGWLADAGLVLRSHRITAPRMPLAGYRDENAYKLYLLDVGLLGARLGLSERTIVSGNDLFVEYHGAFAENFVAQELTASRAGRGGHAAGDRAVLYYWTSDGLAEVDFLVEEGERIYPLEVKAGASAKKKSLLFYGNKYAPPALSRATAMNFKRDGTIFNYPLYAVSRFPMAETMGEGKAY